MRTPNQILKDEGVDTAKLANVSPNLYSSVIRAMGEFAEQYHKWKVNAIKTSDDSVEVCEKLSCNRRKLKGSVYCKYHYDINFG